MKDVLEFMSEYLMNERLDKIVAKNSYFKTEEAKANIALEELEEKLTEEQRKLLNSYTALQNACSATYASLAYKQGMSDIVNLVLGLVVK